MERERQINKQLMHRKQETEWQLMEALSQVGRALDPEPSVLCSAKTVSLLFDFLWKPFPPSRSGEQQASHLLVPPLEDIPKHSASKGVEYGHHLICLGSDT